MTIGRLIEGRDAVLTCDVSATVREAAGILADRRIGALPIMENGAIAGIFSERDVIYRLREFGHEMLDMTVGDVMMIGFVSIGDLVKYRIDAMEAEAAAMRDYIRTA